MWAVVPYIRHMTTETVGIIPTWTLPDRLRKARELTGLDQVAFAAELGVNRNTVSNAETGARRPIRLTLRAWALRTGVDPNWLETGLAPVRGDQGQNSYAARESNPQPAGLKPDTWATVTDLAERRAAA